MAKYPKVRAGQWVQPTRHGYRMACCDCGLIHVLDFKLVKYGNGKHKIRFRAFRDDRATRKRRQRALSAGGTEGR